MSEVTLHPYIFFKGQCREAMEFYKQVFGGELTFQTYGEVPGATDADKEKIMHAMLEGGDAKLFASDTSEAADKTAKIELTLGGSDEPKLKKIFADLSEGGTVTAELKKEFWGDTFGKLTDKFGVDWMFNIAAK